MPRITTSLLALVLLATVIPIRDARAQDAPRRTDTQVIRTWQQPVKNGTYETTQRVEVAFDYAQGVTLRRTYDAAGQLRSEERVAIQPRPNTDEIAEATAIIQADPELAPLLASSGATIEGGFVYNQVDFERPLAACDASARCLQFDLVAPNRIESVRFVVVDLATRQVVEHDLFPEL